MAYKLKRKIIKGLAITSILLLPGMKGKTESLEYTVYDRDSVDGEVIGKLNINSNFFKVLNGNNLDLINYNNHLGFIEKSNTLPLLNNLSYERIDSIGYPITNINLRIGPGIDFDSIMVFNSNTSINIIASINNGWYLIEYNNYIGFVSSEYIKIIDKDKVMEQVIMLPTSYKSLIAKTDVNFREKPNINSNKITLIHKGDKLILNKKLDNGWYEAIYNNQVGYVCGDYADEVYSIMGDCYSFAYCIDNTTIYDFPYGNEIDLLPQYEALKIYGEVDNYYYVESDGKVGFIVKSNCKTLTGRFIIVDISSQTMTLYDGVDVVLTSSIVSGKRTTPTDLGIYSISSKQKNRVLRGVDYETPVKYWMGYNHGEGLHDASWRHSFGGEIYIKNGSHGCVNLPEKVARELYTETSIGNKVLVKK